MNVKSGLNSCFKSNCGVLFFIKVTGKCRAIHNGADSSVPLLKIHTNDPSSADPRDSMIPPDAIKPVYI